MTSVSGQGAALRVAFNAALLSARGDYTSAGISRHIAGLLAALARRDDVALTVLVADAEAIRSLPGGVRVVVAPGLARRPAGRVAWEQTALPARLARAGVDLLHSPAYGMPLASPAPVVVTVHDLSFFRMPDTLGRFQAAYLRAATRLAVRRAAALIAVSAFTRRELIEVAGAHPSRVHVVPNGVGETFRRSSPEQVAAFRAARSLPRPFVLAVGTVQPRKNLGALIDAYALLRGALGEAPDLVIVGAAGWGTDDVATRTAAHGLDNHVHRLGYLGDDELPTAYSAAALVVVPSKYEGFGLPVIEAMACGTPVIAAASSSLPEVAGDAALLVPPSDVDCWVRAIRAVLEDNAIATRLAAAGTAHAALFTWSRAAEATAAVYGRVLTTAPANQASIRVVGRGS